MSTELKLTFSWLLASTSMRATLFTLGYLAATEASARLFLPLLAASWAFEWLNNGLSFEVELHSKQPGPLRRSQWFRKWARLDGER